MNKTRLVLAALAIMTGVAFGETLAEKQARLEKMKADVAALEKEISTQSAKIPSTRPPTTASRPATKPAAARTWKWTNSDLSTDENVKTLKETLVGMTMDEMCTALQAANFTPPSITSASKSDTNYATSCIIHTKIGDGFYGYTFHIVVSDGKVSQFTTKYNDL